MNGLIGWWAKNSVAANLLMFFIIIIGIFTYNNSLSRETFPSVAQEAVEVNISWPGASPTDSEEQLLLRMEEAVANLENIEELTSTAYEGGASMTVEMEKGGDFDSFLNEVKSRIDGVSNLPQDSFPPVVRRQNFQQELAFMDLTGDETVEFRDLNRLARELRDELAALPGGSPIVDVDGLRTEEVSIEISETALRRYGLTFGEVAQAVRRASLNLSMGEVQTTTGNIPLATRNLADTSEEFGEIVVRQNLDGSIIRVKDIATVIDGFPDSNYIYEIDGKIGMTLTVRQPTDSDVIAIVDVLENWVEERSKTLPPGVELTFAFTLAEFYEGRFKLVTGNAAQGLVLVLIILMLFLRPTVAFWVAAGIGVSFLGTFILFPILGVSLNMLSLFGLLLVIGIVVDDALVVGESINRQVEVGKTGLDAAVIGTQIVAKPVLFAVLTTMLAFSPFLIIGGDFGGWLSSISWVVILALTFSLIESFLILPSHLAHLKPPSDTGILKFQRKLADGLLWFADRFYRPLITMAIHGRAITITLFIGLFAVSVALLNQGWIQFAFFPDVENRFIQTRIAMQQGTSWERQMQVFDQVQAADAELRKELEERLGKDVVNSTSTRAWTGTVFSFNVFLDSEERGDITMAEIGDIYRDKIGPVPDAEEIEISSNFSGSNNRFFLSIEATDLDQAAAASNEIKEYMRSVPILYDVRDNLQAPLDEKRLVLKPGAERFGVTVQDVALQLRQAYFGEEVQRLPRDGQDVRVIVRYPEAQRRSLEGLFSDFRIRTPDGRQIPISSVAEFENGPAVRFIRRTDRKRSVTVFARIRDGADAGPFRGQFYGQVVPEILSKYPDVSVKQRGADQEQNKFLGELFVLSIAVLFGMYMLLAIAFGSYFQPILIMSAIPFGFMGAVFGHLIWGVDFAMFSFFGIAAAAGVVVNDNLVLVDYVNRLRSEGAGAFAALVEAGTVRFRPILLTSVTTFIGLLPILFEQSLDAQFLKPVVISLAFGVLFALFVTLFFVPAMYAVGADIQRFFRSLWTGERQPRLGEGASLDGIPEIKGSGQHAPAE
ncbi:efflux RND transporter permease subunit [Parvularcula maris]|uniref:Efflux RND transporter permease subunit n=1 Tax=Parvularcula maris TaxID=2965077 RepID=A0A9X2L6X6_9PROT|nr:efflux RND transporter permease subunit [Parvularcula maris]MCQ8184176.1 efflux RND transporter permease subunit [Parvularcula maris]